MHSTPYGIIYGIVAILLFTNCKKATDVSSVDNEHLAQQVTTYLQNQKAANNLDRNTKIDHLISNLDLSSIEMQQLNNSEHLIVVSIAGTYRTINNKNVDHPAFYYSLLGQMVKL